MSENRRSGSCLCGTVHYEATLQEDKAHICHCRICQKWDGGPALSVQCQDWTIEGEGSVTWYDSSEWARRGFCGKCGSHLFFQTKDGSYHGITAGSLDSQDGLTIDSHIFVDTKPSYYDFTDNSPRLTEEEFLAQFTGEGA